MTEAELEAVGKEAIVAVAEFFAGTAALEIVRLADQGRPNESGWRVRLIRAPKP
jgi:hypothetical protein